MIEGEGGCPKTPRDVANSVQKQGRKRRCMENRMKISKLLKNPLFLRVVHALFGTERLIAYTCNNPQTIVKDCKFKGLRSFLFSLLLFNATQFCSFPGRMLGRKIILLGRKRLCPGRKCLRHLGRWGNIGNSGAFHSCSFDILVRHP